MGLGFSKLLKDEREIQDLCNETGFSENQIQRLYHRFCNLDSGHKGYLTSDDLLSIPELAANPLGERIVLAMYRERKKNFEHSIIIRHTTGGQNIQHPLSIEDIKIPFRYFVRSFARFRYVEKSDTDNESHPNHGMKPNKKEEKSGKSNKNQQDAIRKVQFDGNQVIGEDEYNSPRGRAMFLFRMLDVNDNGQVELSEIFALLKLLFPRLDEGRLIYCSDQLLTECNGGDKNAKVMTFDQFCEQENVLSALSELCFRFTS